MHIYGDFKGTISIAEQAGDNPHNGNKETVFQNCAPITDCISEINNTEIIDYRDNYSTTYGKKVSGNTVNMNQL